jgi:hypothetical protein
MCFLKGRQNKHKVSDKDITCYKVMTLLGDDIVSSYYFPRNNSYRIGDTIEPSENVKDTVIDKSDFVNGGVIHSYADYAEAFLESIPLGKVDEDIVIVECVIPAGTSYWKNKYGEYISKKVIIKRVCLY